MPLDINCSLLSPATGVKLNHWVPNMYSEQLVQYFYLHCSTCLRFYRILSSKILTEERLWTSSGVESEAEAKSRRCRADCLRCISFASSVVLPANTGLLRDDTDWRRSPAGCGEGGCWQDSKHKTIPHMLIHTLRHKRALHACAECMVSLAVCFTHHMTQWSIGVGELCYWEGIRCARRYQPSKKYQR